MLEPPEERERTERAVLVVDRRDAARRRELDPAPHRVEVLVRRHAEVARAEVPRVGLEQDAVAGGLAGRRVRGRVEPERVRVLRPERGGRVAGRRVELRAGVGSSPPNRQPSPRIQPPAPGAGARDERERLLDGRAALEPHLRLRERPGREVDVRVGEPGHDGAPAEVDRLGRGERRLVDADAAGDPPARDRERALRRQRRVERADEAVLEDHGPECRDPACRTRLRPPRPDRPGVDEKMRNWRTFVPVSPRLGG